VTSSSQVALHWSQASGLFGIAGYVLRATAALSQPRPTRPSLMSASRLNPRTAIPCRPLIRRQLFRRVGGCSGGDLAIRQWRGPNSRRRGWSALGHPIRRLGTFNSLPGYYGSGFLSEENIDVGESLIFRPPLPQSGNYTVYIQYPASLIINYLFADNVPVDHRPQWSH